MITATSGTAMETIGIKGAATVGAAAEGGTTITAAAGTAAKIAPEPGLGTAAGTIAARVNTGAMMTSGTKPGLAAQGRTRAVAKTGWAAPAETAATDVSGGGTARGDKTKGAPGWTAPNAAAGSIRYWTPLISSKARPGSSGAATR